LIISDVFERKGAKMVKDIRKKLKFGIFYAPLPSWPVLRERIQHVESLGFDSMWLVDHFVNPVYSDCPWMDAWTLLAGMAACSKNVKLGTLVTNIIYRNPALIAKQALTVDQMSDGRLVLGIGAGSPNDLSHPMTGIDPWPNRERVSRFEEIVTIVDQMLRNHVTTFEGEYYKVTDAVMLPAPIQQPRPPLLIAAHGPRMLKIAATYADNWNSLGGLQYSSEEALRITRDNNHRLSELAAAQGRDPDQITRSFCVGWTHDKPFDSIGAFQDFIGRYSDAGIEEFMFGYWLDDDVPKPVPLAHINSSELLERIALDGIPGLKV
jgi:alkanesulfonate monooxygenase SsuD/methylene tetrahydromethanopterin reductase-like flavin-dependent oxidoreductase (luciferase family)